MAPFARWACAALVPCALSAWACHGTSGATAADAGGATSCASTNACPHNGDAGPAGDDGGPLGSSSGGADAGSDAPTSSPEAGACHGDSTPLPCMPESVFYDPVPATPHLASNSAAILAYYAANWGWNYTGTPTWDKGVQLWPDVVPDPAEQVADGDMASVYFAKVSDPVFTVKCFESWCANGGEPIDGTQIHIPEGARWQFYPDCADAGAGQMTRGSCGDDHFEVVSPDGTTEYDLYEAFGCFTNGSTCLVGSGGIVAYATSTGFSTQGGANATDWVPTQGLVLPSEILAGVIPHALALILNCSDGTSVAPATANAAGDACSDTTNALSEGQRIFLTATDAQIESWGSSGVTAAGQIVLEALAHYGGYYVDNLGYGGFIMETLNQWSYQPPGTLTDDWPAVAAKYSLSKTGYAGSYDLGVENVPGGITSWLAVCDKSGC
jgi:hypothetical protein